MVQVQLGAAHAAPKTLPGTTHTHGGGGLLAQFVRQHQLAAPAPPPPFSPHARSCGTQAKAPWGLARIHTKHSKATEPAPQYTNKRPTTLRTTCLLA
jgi:hypothetical protein